MKVQTLNLLRRCLSGDSLASMFYWTIYKRGDSDSDSPGILASFRSRYDISHNVDPHRTTNPGVDGVRNWVEVG